jgi:hypothetical protein
MPTKREEMAMAAWLRRKRIAFEVTRLDIDKSIELNLTDYIHNCLIVSKVYRNLNPRMGLQELEALVKKFEQEEVYPILFDSEDTRVTSTPVFRLIRED